MFRKFLQLCDKLMLNLNGRRLSRLTWAIGLLWREGELLNSYIIIIVFHILILCIIEFSTPHFILVFCRQDIDEFFLTNRCLNSISVSYSEVKSPKLTLVALFVLEMQDFNRVLVFELPFHEGDVEIFLEMGGFVMLDSIVLLFASAFKVP